MAKTKTKNLKRLYKEVLWTMNKPYSYFYDIYRKGRLKVIKVDNREYRVYIEYKNKGNLDIILKS
jgi:hypothetical protein